MKKVFLAFTAMSLMLVLLFSALGNNGALAALSKSKPWYDFFPPIPGQPDEVRGVDPIKLRKTVRSWSEKHISTEFRAGKRQQRWEGIITPYHLSEDVYAELNSNLSDNSISMDKVENLTEEINNLKEDVAALSGGMSVEPGGLDQEIQFNSTGSFAGEEEFKWDYASNTLHVDGTADFSSAKTLISSGNYSDLPSSCNPGEIFVAYNGTEDIQVDSCNYWGEIYVRMYVCVAEDDWEPVVEDNTSDCG